MAGLTKKQAGEVETLRQAAFLLSANQQYRLAFMIAENIGFTLKSNDPLADLSVPFDEISKEDVLKKWPESI